MDDKMPSLEPRRPFVRFTLRGLAIVVALIAIALSYFNSAISGARPTGRELDVAIFGRGYLQVLDLESGETYYTRCGRLSVNADGRLFVRHASDVWQLDPAITVPSDWVSMDIDKDGSVAITDGTNRRHVQIGAIQLARFTNDEGLQEVVPNLYAKSETSGVAVVGEPGSNGLGLLQQGWLERSPSYPTIAPSAIAGICLVVVIFVLVENRRLHRRLDDVIARWPECR
jgi:hypothetical protein